MRRALVVVLVSVFVAGCGGSDPGSGDQTTAAPPPGGEGVATRLEKVGDFEQPVYLASPPGDAEHRYVVEQGGTIRLVGSDAPFLDITDRVTSGGEQGLLSVAFAPDYAQSRRFYVYYTNGDGDQEIDGFTARDDTAADPDSRVEILTMDDSESNHNGGLLLFGPDDHLYVGTGDGGGAGDQHGELGNAQDKDSLLGKLLRIDPKPQGGYDVPAGNPFGTAVFSLGLRNPWRYSFDGDNVAIGDVGQNEYEEIDYVTLEQANGGNFGWRPFEGTHVYVEGESAPGAIEPVIEQTHSDGNCSITGGVVVRDPELTSLTGKYVFGDFCKGDVFQAQLTPGRATGVRETGLHVDGLASFATDAEDHVYLISNSGPIYRLRQG